MRKNRSTAPPDPSGFAPSGFASGGGLVVLECMTESPEPANNGEGGFAGAARSEWQALCERTCGILRADHTRHRRERNYPRRACSWSLFGPVASYGIGGDL